MKEFNLSKKETHWLEESNWNIDDNENPYPIEFKGIDGYRKEDVKKFIKKLKEEIKNTTDLDDTCSLRARKIIDKLAGEKLC